MLNSLLTVLCRNIFRLIPKIDAKCMIHVCSTCALCEPCYMYYVFLYKLTDNPTSYTLIFIPVNFPIIM